LSGQKDTSNGLMYSSTGVPTVSNSRDSLETNGAQLVGSVNQPNPYKIKKTVNGKMSCLYCVPLHLGVFFKDLPNKRYNFDDLSAVAYSNDVSFFVTDGSQTLVINDGCSSWYKLIVNQTHTHLKQVIRADCNLLTDNDMLDPGSLLLASKRRRKNNKAAKASIKPEVDFIVPTQTPVKMMSMGGKAPRRKPSQLRTSTKRSILKSPIVALARHLQQVTYPYEQSELLRWPDANGDQTALQRNFSNVTLNSILFGAAGWLGLLHSADFSTEYFVNSANLTSVYSFVLASLSNTGPDGGDNLSDTVLQAANNNVRSTVIPNVKQVSGSGDQWSFIIPMHSAIATSSDASQYVAMIAPGELYDSNGNLSNGVANTPSGPTGTAFPVVSTAGGSDTISVVLTSQVSVTGVSATLMGTFGNGSSTTTYALGTFTLTDDSMETSTVSIPLYSVVGAQDRLENLSIVYANSNTSPCLVTQQSIIVTLVTVGLPVTYGSPANYIPFGYWTGRPNASIDNLAFVEQQRCIASSVLFTDVSSVLNAQGIMYMAQISTGTLPAEAGITGIQSIGAYDRVLVGRERDGGYNAPFKLANLNSSQFYDADKAWVGIQPYTVVMVKTDAATPLTFRAQVTSIYEFRCTEQQVLPIATAIVDEVMTAKIRNMFAGELLLCLTLFILELFLI